MASNVNPNRLQSQGTPTKSPQHMQQQQSSGFEQLDKSSSNTLKRNPKMELNKADLLKLMSYLEGELQAREIVIATLKSEKVKQLLNLGGYRPASINDPMAALQRDSFAATEPRVDELQIRALADHQMSSLDNLILQQRKTQLRISRVLKEAEERHKKELEAERQAKKKIEKDYKKALDLMEEERVRMKHIVLLLLAERKKIITKYIEESKRSEDLAQILSEEKGRVDTMAEGLEEESKKSLQMEAELEKHLAQFDTERQQLKAAVFKEEKRVKELEAELEKAKQEVESLKKQLAEAHQVAMFEAGPPRVARPGSTAATPPPPPAKPSLLASHTSPRPSQPTMLGKGSTWAQPGMAHAEDSVSPPPPAGTPMMSSVAKVVQPTATVSSVPVCGPTTGIARSVSPGQGIRNVTYSATNPTDSRNIVAGRDGSTWPQQQTPVEQPALPVPPDKAVSARIVPSVDRSQPQVVQVTPRVSLSASPGTKVFTTTQGGKVTFHVTTNSGGSPLTPPQATQVPATVVATPAAAITSPAIVASLAPAQQPMAGVAPVPPKKVSPLGRGVPPPVPPNKPVVPPKKETVPRAPPAPDASSVAEAKKAVPGLKFGTVKEKIRLPGEAGSGDVVSGGAQRPGAAGAAVAEAGGRAGRREQPQVGGAVPEDESLGGSAEVAANGGVALAHVARPPALHATPDLDMLGQELADFQDLLSSMVSGADIASSKSADPPNSIEATPHCVPVSFNGNFKDNNFVALGPQNQQDAVSNKASDYHSVLSWRHFIIGIKHMVPKKMCNHIWCWPFLSPPLQNCILSRLLPACVKGFKPNQNFWEDYIEHLYSKMNPPLTKIIPPYFFWLWPC
ncbi:CTTNBP2 N-terminal-like protein isoform X2 [Ischnura elegans]|uniref:CTTNBP2 N-terminal-like protein isoform X2 n=1 Tax=Ischnura elegans TaxID=197161 RepID=UPI001ED86F1D|nr:CTTNBP2 N-terminal-like protein isoform X2 [Ischnura elegans]